LIAGLEGLPLLMFSETQCLQGLISPNALNWCKDHCFWIDWNTIINALKDLFRIRNQLHRF
jgi:hypothetical protein